MRRKFCSWIPPACPRALEALAVYNCEFKLDLDAIDEHGPTVFGAVTGTTELSEDDISQFVSDLISPHSGDVIEWTYIPNPRTHRAEFIQAYEAEALRSAICFDEKPCAATL